MALDPRQKMFFFVGLCMALYGLSLTILGVWSIDYTSHGASGGSMWCGIVIIMCGVGDIIISLDSDEKDNIGGFSMGALLANMVAMLMGILVIALSTWGAYDQLDFGIQYAITEPSIEVYVTVVLMGIFVTILSLVALMYDCCCGAGLFGAPVPAQAYPAEVYQQQGYPLGATIQPQAAFR